MTTKAYVHSRLNRDNMAGKAVEVYDFEVHGGAVSTITLPLTLPAGAIVTGGYAFVESAILSTGSATVSLGLNNTTDLLAATAKADLDTNDVLPLLPGYTEALDGNAAAGGVMASTPLRLTAERQLKAAIAVEALTAGKIVVYLEYIGPFDIQPVTTHLS